MRTPFSHGRSILGTLSVGQYHQFETGGEALMDVGTFTKTAPKVCQCIGSNLGLMSRGRLGLRHVIDRFI